MTPEPRWPPPCWLLVIRVQLLFPPQHGLPFASQRDREEGLLCYSTVYLIVSTLNLICPFKTYLSQVAWIVSRQGQGLWVQERFIRILHRMGNYVSFQNAVKQLFYIWEKWFFCNLIWRKTKGTKIFPGVIDRWPQAGGRYSSMEHFRSLMGKRTALF